MTLKKSEWLRIAYEMKENFRRIYETNLTVEKGQKKIKEWLNHHKCFLENLHQQLKIILRVFVTTLFIGQQVE
ncbi:transposase [Microcoleus sp. N9_B2]